MNTRSGRHLSLVRLAGRWRGRRIALFGGSFNPAHDGHFHVAAEILKRQRIDAVWLLVSPGNPLKSGSDMAPFPLRMASASLIASRHPDVHAMDIERHLGSAFTIDTLRALKRTLPGVHFLWVMGVDNLKNFHHWRGYQEIAATVPIAIYDRTEYSSLVRTSRFARFYAKKQASPRRLVNSTAPAWSFQTLRRHKASATHLRGQADFRWPTKLGKET